MYNVFDVANWFLQKEPMTHKKLQKLCYYAQAWSLALRSSEIMEDVPFEAWVHGPVNPELWRECRDFGWNSIDKDFLSDKANSIDEKDVELLESVWETYGHLYGSQLETLTHTEPPWINARGDVDAFCPSNTVISCNDMKNYYRSVYAGGQGD